jgi:hypothetical protein
VRGSLDVLLSTPMSTRSILAGKWWGSYRRILNVAIWPAATSIVLLREGGNGMCYVALLGLVFAYGAAITSLGLALATWVSRIGRAVALCITLHVAWMVGWPFAVAFGVGRPAMRYIGMMIGDPPAGMFFGTFVLLPKNVSGIPLLPAPDAILPSMIAWIVVISGFAAALFAVMVATFDRCLGRISDGAARPTSSRPRPMSTAELLARVPSAAGAEYDEGEEGLPFGP